MSLLGINTDCMMMRAISSHQDHRGSKMRFLIVSAVLACAAAAPSHLLAPVALPAPVVPVAGVAAVPVAYSAAIPTISPGDIQGAAIDAQVRAQDLAIAISDKTREINDQAAQNLKQATEEIKDQAVINTDVIKENTEEAFWAVQEKQWQALDAVKTAEAQLDGALARDAPVLAKNTVVGIAPIAPILYTPGIVAPVVKTIEAAKLEEAKPEEAKVEEKGEALVKSVEDAKAKDSVTIEAATRNLDAKPQLAPVFTPLAIQPYYNQGYPIIAPVSSVGLASPVLKYTAFPQLGLAPAIVKTAW